MTPSRGVTRAGQRSVGRPEFAVAARALTPSVEVTTARMLDHNDRGPSDVNFDALYDLVVSALASSREQT